MRVIENLDEISDGKSYGIGDMVKADPSGCEGCHACCLGVDQYVAINPLDFYQLCRETLLDPSDLLASHLFMVESKKLQVPHLKTVGETGRCTFLNQDNRCSVHPARPDICRLFPLARVYDREDYHYTLQVDACVKPKLDKVKVKKHLQIDHYNTYKAFIWTWYQVVKALHFRLKFAREPEALAAINRDFLEAFYLSPDLQGQESVLDFFEAFQAILPEAKSKMGIL